MHLKVQNVLMPFSPEFKNQWECAFIPAIVSVNLTPFRGDEATLETNTIIKDITKSIYDAQIIIADLTGRNPGSYILDNGAFMPHTPEGQVGAKVGRPHFIATLWSQLGLPLLTSMRRPNMCGTLIWISPPMKATQQTTMSL
jgi:hypothetical protein